MYFYIYLTGIILSGPFFGAFMGALDRGFKQDFKIINIFVMTIVWPLTWAFMLLGGYLQLIYKLYVWMQAPSNPFLEVDKSPRRDY